VAPRLPGALLRLKLKSLTVWPVEDLCQCGVSAVHGGGTGFWSRGWNICIYQAPSVSRLQAAPSFSRLQPPPRH
jgi:hypothetical protein